MPDNLAKVITNVFSAPWVCGYVLLYYLNKYRNFVSMNIIIGVLIFLYLLPWGPVLMYSMIKKKNPSKLSAIERIPFVFVGLISYLAGIIYFNSIEPRTVVSEFLIAINVMYVVFSLLIVIGNVWSKPSIHVGGFVAPITLVALYDNLLLLLSLILTPIIGWTRIKLRIHTIKQLISGFLIGLFSAVVAFLIGLTLI